MMMMMIIIIITKMMMCLSEQRERDVVSHAGNTSQYDGVRWLST